MDDASTLSSIQLCPIICYVQVTCILTSGKQLYSMEICSSVRNVPKMFLEVISIYYVLFQNSISNFYRNKHLSFPYSIKFIFFVVICSALLFKLIDYTSFCPLSWFKLVSQGGKQAKKTSKTFYVQERANLTPCFNNLFSTHKILLFSSFFFFFLSSISKKLNF